MADVKILTKLSLKKQVDLLSQLTNEQLVELIKYLPTGATEFEVGNSGWSMEISTVIDLASQRGLIETGENNVPLRQIEDIQKSMKNGESGGTSKSRQNLSQAVSRWNKDILNNNKKQVDVNDLPLADVAVEKTETPKIIETENEVKPVAQEPDAPKIHSTVSYPVVSRAPEKGQEQIKTKPTAPVYVPGEGVKTEATTQRGQEIASARERIITKQKAAAGESLSWRDYLKSPEKAAGGLVQWIRTKGLGGVGEKSEPGGSTEPKGFAGQVKEFFRQTPQEQVEQMIETKRRIAEQEAPPEPSETQPERLIIVPSIFKERSMPQAAVTRANVKSPPPPPSRPREYTHAGGVPGAMGKVRFLASRVAGGVKDRIKNSIFGTISKKIAGSAVGKAVGAFFGSAIPGLGTAAGFLLGAVVDKLWPKIKKFFKWAIPMALTPVAAFFAGLGGLGSLVGTLAGGAVSATISAMGLGAGLATTGWSGLLGAQAIGGIAVAAGTIFSTVAITSAFTQFPENNSPVRADSPPPVVNITKSPSLANAINYSDIPSSGITYTITFNSLSAVSSGKVTDTVTVISKAGSKSQIMVNQAYTGNSITYVVDKSLVTNDSVIVNNVTVTGTANGKTFTANASTEIIVGTPPITAFSCPVFGGRITCGSTTTEANGQETHDTSGLSCYHCDEKYIAANGTAVCNWPGNDKAIDVVGSLNQSVYFPAIDGQKVVWQLVREGNDLNYTYNGSNQKFREFSAKVNGTDYMLQIHHLVDDNLLSGKSGFNSGDVLGKLAGFDGNESSPHAHIQLQRAGVWTAADDPTLKFCQ